MLGSGSVFPIFPHCFSTGFSTKNQQAASRRSLKKQGEFHFSTVSTGSTATTAILLYIPSFLFRFAENERGKDENGFLAERRRRKCQALPHRGGGMIIDERFERIEYYEDHSEPSVISFLNLSLYVLASLRMLSIPSLSLAFDKMNSVAG